jgi:arylsulfatase A-like enzyme
MRAAGYRTLVAGKWQLSKRGGQTPSDAGFDEQIVHPGGAANSRYWGPTFDIDGELRSFEAGRFGPDVVSERVVQFIERNRDRPFIVYYPLLLPHRPLVATPDAPDATTPEAMIIAMVEYVDKMVGEVVRALDALGLREQTLLLFTADNGTITSMSSELESASGEVVRIQGGKGHPTDAGTHVPFIASLPGTVPTAVNGDIVDFTVFRPTLVEIASGERRTGLDGDSIVDQLFGLAARPRGWAYVYYDPFARSGADALSSEFARDERFKLYRQRHCEPIEMLFDLSVDPLERSPIAPATGSAEQEAMRGELRTILERLRPGPVDLPRSCRGR